MRLRYWIKEALKLTGIVIIASFAYTLLMMGVDAADTWRYYLNMGAMYLAMFGAFMSMVLGASIYQVFVPLAISFGSTRREVLFGIQCYRLVSMLLILAVSAILLIISEGMLLNNEVANLPTGVGAFLMLNGSGIILGCCSTKLGKARMIIVGIVTMILTCSIIGAVIFLAAVKYQMRGNTMWVILIVGILVYLLCMIYEVKTIRKFSVK